MSSEDYHGGVESLLYGAQDQPRVKNLFWVLTALMQCAGQIPMNLNRWLPDSLEQFGNFIAGCYSAFVIFSVVHTALLFGKTTFDMQQLGELEEFSDALTSAIVYSFASFAACYWVRYHRDLEVFLERINSNYRHHSLAGGTFLSTYSQYRRTWKCALIWVTSCISGATLKGITPLVLGTRGLPLKCWYPFDNLRTGVYSLVYALQMFTQVSIGLLFGSGSALVVVLCVTMLSQFDVLFCSLKNLDFHARLMAGESLNVLRSVQSAQPFGVDDEINQYMFLREFKTDLRVFENPSRCRKGFQPEKLKSCLHSGLVECVKLHHFILESCNQLEVLLNPYCLVKSLQITVQLCLLVFVGVSGERNTMRIVNQLSYFLLTLMELWIFTYFGQLLRTHSVRAGEAFFRSNWWMHAHGIRKDALIFLTNSRREVKLTAGKFFIMDVERLRLVITQSLSFLTLLQKIADKKL